MNTRLSAFEGMRSDVVRRTPTCRSIALLGMCDIAPDLVIGAQLCPGIGLAWRRCRHGDSYKVLRATIRSITKALNSSTRSPNRTRFPARSNS